MRFIKMQGLGNDYVYVDLFHERLPEPPESLAIKLARPHFGVGADGLILIEPSAQCDARMRVFNADGSEARMCGNGIRCVGKYLYDSGLCKKPVLRVDTPSGIKAVSMHVEGGLATGATVDMGEPVLQGPASLGACGRDWDITRVSMGNPHAVCFLPALPEDDLFRAAGAALEQDPLFPDRANIEFCHVRADGRIAVRVWERGSGETLACGTGACAVLVAAVANGLTGRRAEVVLPGGALTIHWRQEDNRVFMTGPANIAFTGEWPA